MNPLLALAQALEDDPDKCWERLSAIPEAVEWLEMLDSDAGVILQAHEDYLGEIYAAYPEVKRHDRDKPCSKCEPGRMCVRCFVRLRAINGMSPDLRATRKLRRYRIQAYQLTLETYEEMIDVQNGACAICHVKPLIPEDLDIDHNHKTGEVRGLLCPKCNQALGMFGDSPTIIDRALAYLELRGHYGETAGDTP